MSKSATSPEPKTADGMGEAEIAREMDRVREENARLREALDDVLVILGDPATYHEDDRTEVAHAVGRAKRGLGLALPRRRDTLPSALR
jgi:hypothetical protein